MALPDWLKQVFVLTDVALPEWSEAFVQARLKKLSGTWTRYICSRGHCGGLCDRKYRDVWIPHTGWFRRNESPEIADDEAGDEESSDTD